MISLPFDPTGVKPWMFLQLVSTHRRHIALGSPMQLPGTKLVALGGLLLSRERPVSGDL